ncbi:hypothetical protein DAEQUDRAFT_724970 [Daedalea quercina L-15889]|uniref:Uncharacterized protein n=1 Tax=Daedalea quercina L-15889 TaxID=1314783 RepID=A0A165RJA5_9APHY|nr:hypothetical protein DAEQUDRAFT_724970 [Daedalea quercina L-15889]
MPESRQSLNHLISWVPGMRIMIVLLALGTTSSGMGLCPRCIKAAAIALVLSGLGPVTTSYLAPSRLCGSDTNSLDLP